VEGKLKNLSEVKNI